MATGINPLVTDNSLDWASNLGSESDFLLGNPFASISASLATNGSSPSGNIGTSSITSSVSSIVNSTTGKIAIVGLFVLLFMKVLNEGKK